ncbi:MAG: thermonuclease family protein [Reyranellaceae bacterium]
MRLSPLASTALLAAVVLALPPDGAAAPGVALPAATEAIDGHSLRLADGTVLRLAGIVAPDAEIAAERPAAEAARLALARLALGQDLLALGDVERGDRHGQRLLQLGNGQGQWLQGELLRAGLVRVWTGPDAAERAAEMLALERQAREARLGIWALPYFAILTPETAGRALDRFQIVEATVAAVGRVRGTVYLNTGGDWRSDFTARLERPALKLFAAAGQDPAALKGRTVRIRGWLRLYNGPFVDVTHPQQIELVEP